jgi:signal transduction histidine kinase
VLDLLLAVLTGVIVVVTSMAAADGQASARPVDAVAVAVVAAGSAGIVVRRRWPAVSLTATVGATLLFVELHYPYGPVFALTAVSMYSVAAWRSTRYAVVAAVVVALVHVVWTVWFENDPEGPLASLLASTAWVAAAIGAGVAVRVRREAIARALADERRRAGYEERLRLAQEVHDVVGHSLAVISMNAGAALHVLGKPGPVPAEPLHRSLRAIRQASNGALDELRAALATFTGTLPAPVARAPGGAAGDGVAGDGAAGGAAPGLAAVPALVAATDVDGLTVTLDVAGSPPAVPPAVDVAGYRIVQEALANVVRHAAASTAGVRIAYEPDAVAITVADDGRGGPATAATTGGTGLASMRERAGALGGSVATGPATGGGFEVRAVLPYGAA